MEQYNYMPIGTVVSYAGATTPIGWLLCDGRTIEEHEYPDLYRVLGSGVLPDLRGEFVRGLDNGRGLDEGRVLGSEQGDAIRNITGTANSCVVGSTGDGISHGAFSKDLITNIETFVSGELPYNNLKFDASLVVPTAEENRPKNVALNYIIKAFNTTTDTETLPIQMAKALNNKIENNYNDQLDATVDIVGKEFYDYIQNSGEKTAGKIYRDRLQKGIFRCLKTTTSVLNTSEFYEPVSNNDFSNKLQNLVKVLETTDEYTVYEDAFGVHIYGRIQLDNELDVGGTKYPVKLIDITNILKTYNVKRVVAHVSYDYRADTNDKNIHMQRCSNSIEPNYLGIIGRILTTGVVIGQRYISASFLTK